MIDSVKKSETKLSESDRHQLLQRIDELEKLLARKKPESKKVKTPKLKIGTDGIPVLVNPVVAADVNKNTSIPGAIKKDDAVIDDIIGKINQEISHDLDELIILLKDSIIDKVKMRLLSELVADKNKR